jgi:hypothetical protein
MHEMVEMSSSSVKAQPFRPPKAVWFHVYATWHDFQVDLAGRSKFWVTQNSRRCSVIGCTGYARMPSLTPDRMSFGRFEEKIKGSSGLEPDLGQN